MRISAKINSLCAVCKGAIRIKDEIEYDPIKKTATHPACLRPDSPESGVNPERTAERLSYRPHADAVHFKWSGLRFLCEPAGIHAARGDGTAHGNQGALWDVPPSDS